jgi:2-polyprenyl-3-methyl-5-hydroxy-6-metoxy-1,4-benzoquinol methylase
MSASEGVKSTSYEYGEAYQRLQADKYRDRHNNHWKYRIQLAHDLIDNYVLQRFAGRTPEGITVVDVGTSIGTFAIEFAKRGFNSIGLDFDAQALKIATELAREEGVEPTFIQADVADWPRALPQIDIAICFDIFEHLHDDELGAFLTAIRRNLSEHGCLVFHTFPTQYDYLLFYRSFLRIPLYPLALLAPRWFERALRAYAALFDVYLLLVRGVDYRDTIKTWSHCNPTTQSRLADILARAGYEILCLESAQLYPYMPNVVRRFRKQPIANRNLYGVAVPKQRAS